MYIPQELAGEVEADCVEWPDLQEEASLMHHVMSQLRRYQEEKAASAGQKWKLPPAGQPISLFSGPTDGKTRTLIRSSDDGECAVILVDVFVKKYSNIFFLAPIYKLLTVCLTCVCYLLHSNGHHPLHLI